MYVDELKHYYFLTGGLAGFGLTMQVMNIGTHDYEVRYAADQRFWIEDLKP